MARTNKTYKSDAFEAIHETALDLHQEVLISKKTIGNFYGHSASCKNGE